MFKGLGNLGNLGNLANLMQQAGSIGSRMEDVNSQLRQERIQGASGGGMITVEVNGLGEVLKLTLEPSLVEKGEIEMLEDLIPAAINDALTKARQTHAESTKTIFEGINIPGLDDAISKFTGNA